MVTTLKNKVAIIIENTYFIISINSVNFFVLNFSTLIHKFRVLGHNLPPAAWSQYIQHPDDRPPVAQFAKSVEL